MHHLDIISHGEKARLFPVVSETNKENRIASIFLAILPNIPELASELLASVGIKTGKQTEISCFTEVVLKNDIEKKDRPDGLIIVKNRNNAQMALVEFKIGKNDLQKDQIERYLKLAKDHQIDKVITISNQFVARTDHSPVQVSKTLLRNVGLFHWSWMSLLTSAQLLQQEATIDDPVTKVLLDEFIRFLEHPSTGVGGFSQMNKGWKEVCSEAKTGGRLSKSSAEVEATMSGWFEEQRDICLLLSRKIGKPVRQKISSKLKKDNVLRLKTEISDFCETKGLSAIYQIPDAASDLVVEADLVRRTIDVSMKLKAPTDKKTTKARINWLLRMLKEDDERIIIRAFWPSRVGHTQCGLAQLWQDPDAIQPDNTSLSPHSFQILLIEQLAGRFAGTRTFIEDLERIVPEFYALAGQNLKSWVPSAPKILAPQNDENDLSSVLKLE